MAIEHGFESPIWMSKAIVANAHPILLKRAVSEVIDHLADAGATGTSPFEVIDRIVQIATVGKYTAPEQQEDEEVYRKVITLQDGKLTPEGEREIQKFLDQLNGVPEAEQMDADMPYDEWLKTMGIPDVSEFPETGEDDDEQE